MAQIGYGKGSSTILPDPPGITPDEFGFTTFAAANTWYHIALTLERKTAGGTSYYVTGNLYTNGMRVLLYMIQVLQIQCRITITTT